MKFSLSRLALISSVLLILAPFSAWAEFTDVPEEHEHYAAVLWLENKEVIQGYDDGTFRPDQEVTRAEALKIILLGSEIEVEEITDLGDAIYLDVTIEDWFAPYVVKATEMNWIQGYDDGYFRPEQTMNLAEALKIVTLINEIETETPDDNPYQDVAADAWFAPYVSYTKDRNIIAAESDGYLHPDYAMTRGSLSEIIYRFGYIDQYDFSEFPISLNWQEYQHDTENFAFQAPFGWEVISGSNGEIVIWHQDESNGQMAWGRTYPNSAMVTMVIDDNEAGLSSANYFGEVSAGLSAYEDANIYTTIAGEGDHLTMVVQYAGEYENIRDLYLEMPDDTFLVVQSSYGNGAIESQLLNYLTEITNSLRYSEASGDTEDDTENTGLSPEEAAEQARENIQMDGQGQAMLDLFSDIELIETDTIGVGTGPVDYYYSAWADITLKYERSFDVILDIEDGETTAF